MRKNRRGIVEVITSKTSMIGNTILVGIVASVVLLGLVIALGAFLRFFIIPIIGEEIAPSNRPVEMRSLPLEGELLQELGWRLVPTCGPSQVVNEVMTACQDKSVLTLTYRSGKTVIVEQANDNTVRMTTRNLGERDTSEIVELAELQALDFRDAAIAFRLHDGRWEYVSILR